MRWVALDGVRAARRFVKEYGDVEPKKTSVARTPSPPTHAFPFPINTQTLQTYATTTLPNGGQLASGAVGHGQMSSYGSFIRHEALKTSTSKRSKLVKGW